MENNEEYLTLNSSKYKQFINNRGETNNKYQIAPNGGYNYYPQNLNKRALMNNSHAVPLRSSDESPLMMIPNNKNIDFKINELQPYTINHEKFHKNLNDITEDDLILDIKFKDSREEKQRFYSHSNNNSFQKLQNKQELPRLTNHNKYAPDVNNNLSLSKLLIDSIYLGNQNPPYSNMVANKFPRINNLSSKKQQPIISNAKSSSKRTFVPHYMRLRQQDMQYK